MSKWKYKLDYEGKILRDLIYNEDETIENIIAIYKQAIKCLNMWKVKLTKADKEEWMDDIELMIKDLEWNIPDVENKSITYKCERENLNYHLRDFYDMCNYGKVWIGI